MKWCTVLQARGLYILTNKSPACKSYLAHRNDISEFIRANQIVFIQEISIKPSNSTF